MPKVSIIMPLYNAEKYVESTIRSILSQSFDDIELIVINDHPTDDTLEIVKSIQDDRIRIVDNDRNRGIAYSRNHGISVAKGEYIALMDDDDICSLDRLEVEVEYLDSNPLIGAVGGLMQEINQDSLPITSSVSNGKSSERIRAHLLFNNCIPNGSMMFRKKILLDNDITFSDNMMGMEDYRFWVEFSSVSNIVILNKVFLYWRVSDYSETKKAKKHMAEERKQVYASIVRYSLRTNSFVLSEDDIISLISIFGEEIGNVDYSNSTLIEIYNILNNIVGQAKSLDIDFNSTAGVCKRKMCELVAEYYDNIKIEGLGNDFYSNYSHYFKVDNMINMDMENIFTNDNIAEKIYKIIEDDRMFLRSIKATYEEKVVIRSKLKNRMLNGMINYKIWRV